MIKYVLSLLLCVTATTGINAQTEQELKDLAMAQAKITSDATVAGDFSTVLDYTLPTVLDMMGGKDGALETVTTAMDGMKQQGFEITKSEVVEMVGFAEEEGEYRCVIQNNVVLNHPDYTINSTSYIFGVYNPEASQWYFIEGSQLKNEALAQMVIPGFKTALEIPDDVRETQQH
ncbi:MAG: hypothetical protein ABJM06_10930 [Gilvibacter sp.]